MAQSEEKETGMSAAGVPRRVTFEESSERGTFVTVGVTSTKPEEMISVPRSWLRLLCLGCESVADRVAQVDDMTGCMKLGYKTHSTYEQRLWAANTKEVKGIAKDATMYAKNVMMVVQLMQETAAGKTAETMLTLPPESGFAETQTEEAVQGIPAEVATMVRRKMEVLVERGKTLSQQQATGVKELEAVEASARDLLETMKKETPPEKVASMLEVFVCDLLCAQQNVKETFQAGNQLTEAISAAVGHLLPTDSLAKRPRD